MFNLKRNLRFFSTEESEAKLERLEEQNHNGVSYPPETENCVQNGSIEKNGIDEQEATTMSHKAPDLIGAGGLDLVGSSKCQGDSSEFSSTNLDDQQNCNSTEKMDRIIEVDESGDGRVLPPTPPPSEVPPTFSQETNDETNCDEFPTDKHLDEIVETETKKNNDINIVEEVKEKLEEVVSRETKSDSISDPEAANGENGNIEEVVEKEDDEEKKKEPEEEINVVRETSYNEETEIKGEVTETTKTTKECTITDKKKVEEVDDNTKIQRERTETVKTVNVQKTIEGPLPDDFVPEYPAEHFSKDFPFNGSSVEKIEETNENPTEEAKLEEGELKEVQVDIDTEKLDTVKESNEISEDKGTLRKKKPKSIGKKGGILSLFTRKSRRKKRSTVIHKETMADFELPKSDDGEVTEHDKETEVATAKKTKEEKKIEKEMKKTEEKKQKEEAKRLKMEAKKRKEESKLKKNVSGSKGTWKVPQNGSEVKESKVEEEKGKDDDVDVPESVTETATYVEPNQNDKTDLKEEPQNFNKQAKRELSLLKRFSAKRSKDKEVNVDKSSGQIENSVSATGTEEPQVKKPEKDYLVVVAIDFGTTFSGYAFSFLNEPDTIHMMRQVMIVII